MLVYSSLKTVFASTLILFASLGFLHADEVNDSLAFDQKRRQVLADSPDERRTVVLGAAEDLARDGYYAEALDLIYGLEDSAATAALSEDFLSDTIPAIAPPTPAFQPLQINGYLQSSLSYDEWEGQDQPFGGHVRAKTEWMPQATFFDRVTSMFQGSERNAYFDFSAKGSAFARMLKVETEALIEKNLWQTSGDSLDRIFVQTMGEGNTRALGKPVSAVLPVRAEVERFHFDRLGYLSSQSLWAAPGLEAVSEDLRKSLSLSWEMKESYYPTSVPSGNFRHGPVAWGEWYAGRISVDAESRYQTYRYVRDTSLYRQWEMETRAGLFVRTWPWLKVGIRSMGGKESVDYRDSVDLTNLNRVQAAYRLQGSIWSLQPQLVWEWASSYSATFSLAYGQGNYPTLTTVDGQELEIPKYLDAPYEDWRPSLGFTILSKTIFLTLSLDYETNTVPANSIYSMGSSRGMGVNGNLFWKLRPWFEIDFTCMVERQLDAGSLPGRIQNMTSLVLGFTSRFP